MPELTNIIVTTTAPSNLLSPGVLAFVCLWFMSAPISTFGLCRRFVNRINAKLQTRSVGWCMICPVSSALLPCITADIRPVGSGCRGNDRWSQESNVPTLVFTFQMDHDDALQISTLLIPLSQSQDIVSRKEMFFLNLHPVQSGWMINWVWQTALLSTFLTPLYKILPLGRMFLPN